MPGVNLAAEADAHADQTTGPPGTGPGEPGLGVHREAADLPAQAAAAGADSGSSWRERYRSALLQLGSYYSAPQTLYRTPGRRTERIVVSDAVANLVQ